VNTAEFLHGLRERDVRLWVEGDRLKCSAPAGVLTGDIQAAIASRKEEILALLRHTATTSAGPRAIVPLKPDGRGPPLFAVPGHDGDVRCYLPLARHLDADQPLLGVQPPGLGGSEAIRSVEELACHEVEQIRKYREQGPYLIAGYRAGGAIAFEIARQLTERRQHVAFLALIGSPFPTYYRRMPGTLAVRMSYVLDVLRPRPGQRSESAGAMDRESVAARVRWENVTLAAMRRYRPGPFPGEVDVFLPSREWGDRSRSARWSTVARAVREHVCAVADGDVADALLQEPDVSALAAALRLRLDEIARLESARAGTDRHQATP
jgi:thioesterase domain-containing protein